MTRTILVVMAHPDDAELTCGGSIARWAREGHQVVLILATDGARGSKEGDTDHEEMARIRRREQEEAARVLGLEQVVGLGFPDGELSDDDALRGALVRQVRSFRPDAVVAMDPLAVIQRNSYVNHRDHRMLGIATLDALYPQASNATYFPEQLAEGLGTHKVAELLLVNTEQPNFWVDVGATLDARFDALRCHASQIRLWPESGEAVIRQQRELASVLGIQYGADYAEEFRRVVVNPLA
jgi:LmbE family N-acetylglucosaminyl deacetylase